MALTDRSKSKLRPLYTHQVEVPDVRKVQDNHPTHESARPARLYQVLLSEIPAEICPLHFNDPLVNSIVIPIYKNRGKRFFEFGDRLNPPH